MMNGLRTRFRPETGTDVEVVLEEGRLTIVFFDSKQPDKGAVSMAFSSAAPIAVERLPGHA